MIHELKILPEYFEAVADGRKKFELRLNDRDFYAGDTLILKEWDTKKYTGRQIEVFVTYILYDWMWSGLNEGWCIMSIDRKG